MSSTIMQGNRQRMNTGAHIYTNNEWYATDTVLRQGRTRKASCRTCLDVVQ